MQKHNGPVSLHGSSSMRFDNVCRADAMNAKKLATLKRVAKALTTGWLSELDVFNATKVVNGWGRESDLRLMLGMEVKHQICPCKGGGHYKRKHITKREFNRVFGSKK